MADLSTARKEELASIIRQRDAEVRDALLAEICAALELPVCHAAADFVAALRKGYSLTPQGRHDVSDLYRDE